MPVINRGDEHFQVVTYTGNGTSQSITGLRFKPDLVWAKIRSTTGNHSVYDSVRGAQQWISTNLTNAEGTYSGVTSFNSDGFTIGSDGGVNTNGATYVAWCWKAGGTGVTNTSGTITSTVSANPSAGFSVVTYSGNSATATVGHGLGVAPSMYIVKSRTYASGGWSVYHTSIGATGAVQLNSTSATITSANFWNNTAPTSSVFSLAGVSAEVNTTGNTYVSYCFAAVRGYSAFGSYNGTGSSDGPMIYTGFRPRFVMVKSISGGVGDWEVRDSSRDIANVSYSSRLFSNSTAAEDTSGFAIDLLSNGFKCRGTGTNSNGSGYTYIYMAFAENPFNSSRAR